MAEAFVYCWTDHKTKKLYVGWHKGKQNDGYICSGKYMLKEYKKRPADFTRQIIATGDSCSMVNLEKQILTSADAGNSDKFYNANNGNGIFIMNNDIKNRISQSKLGKKRSIESCVKQSKSVSGKKNHFYGKTHSVKIRKIMSIKAKKRSVGSSNNNAKKVSYNNELFGCKKHLTEKYGFSLYMINKMINNGEVTYA